MFDVYYLELIGYNNYKSFIYGTYATKAEAIEAMQEIENKGYTGYIKGKGE